MEHDLERVSIDALMSLQEIAASGRADIAALIAKFRAQRQRAAGQLSRRNFRRD
jgi:hypothetical protein